jgi:hypothetical protein
MRADYLRESIRGCRICCGDGLDYGEMTSQRTTLEDQEQLRKRRKERDDDASWNQACRLQLRVKRTRKFVLLIACLSSRSTFQQHESGISETYGRGFLGGEDGHYQFV